MLLFVADLAAALWMAYNLHKLCHKNYAFAVFALSMLHSRAVKIGGGGYCLLKKAFMRTFPRNQEVTVKLKSELNFIKF